MHLVVGLGNPGRQYQGNRHNVGFRAVDELAGGAPWRGKWGAELAEVELSGEKVLLCKPMQFMNVSGQPVASVAGFWKIPAEQVVVIHDELDVAFGRVKINKGGGAGGHNGVRSLIDCLGTPDFVRVRVGIGRPPPNWEGADYVLADFSRAEQPELPGMISAAAAAAKEIVTRGLTAAMNRYNVRPPNDKKSPKNGDGA